MKLAYKAARISQHFVDLVDVFMPQSCWSSFAFWQLYNCTQNWSTCCVFRACVCVPLKMWISHESGSKYFIFAYSTLVFHRGNKFAYFLLVFSDGLASFRFYFARLMKSTKQKKESVNKSRKKKNRETNNKKYIYIYVRKLYNGNV